MPAAFAINNQTTSDVYADACTIAGAPLSTRVVLQVTGAAVFYELQNQGGAWGDEKFLTPVVGARSLVLTGIRFRSAVSGQPAQVSAEIVTPEELGSGADTIAAAGFTVAPNGSVGPVETNLQTGDFFFSSGDADRANALLVNGRALNASTDASLEALWELWGIYFGGTGKSNFLMPDAPGRTLVVVGSHADVDALGSNDGTVLADRTPKHATSSTLAINNTLALVDPDHRHTYPTSGAGGTGQSTQNGGGGGVPGTTDSSATGITLTGGVALTGGIGAGAGRPVDVVPFLALYLMVVK